LTSPVYYDIIKHNELKQHNTDWRTLMLTEAKKIIEDADVIICMAGAGIGHDSGLPTFRGDDGFWKAYPKLGKKKMSFARIATQYALNENPQLAWSLYGHMFDLFNDTIPHTGFNSLLKMCEDKEDYFVVTSNIDCHFQKAGFDTNKIYEIHGRINKFQCTECGQLWEVSPSYRFDVNTTSMAMTATPFCKECGGLARPNIMLFNDTGFDTVETEQQAVRFNECMHKYDKGNHKIAIIEIGAGDSVPTIRIMSEYIQQKVDGATLIRINPMDSDGPEGTISVKVGALEAINTII